ncbi:hypothetical protein [Enterobacter hormaechei]|uniref:LexA family protein n=3 Tax=Enterobacter TaxID=547 RepID=UPI003BB99666
MKKLSTEHENAVRDVARQCNDAIKKALKQKPKPSWNVVVPPILKEYHEKVKPMGVQQRNRTPERALWSRVMIELTPRQNEVFEAIKVHIEKAGFPPTMLELAGLIGCASPNAAVAHVKSLKKKGYITVAPGAARGITVVKTEWDADPVTIIKDLLSDGDKARDNAVEWLKKQGVTL